MSQAQPLSAVLAEIAAYDRPAITVAELTQKFGGRALGALLFLFGIACFLPLPPGALGYLYLPALAVISLASMLLAPLGARTAHRMDIQPLRKLFALVLYGLALYFLLR